MQISEKLPKFKRQFWPIKRADGQNKGAQLQYIRNNIYENFERLTVSEE